MEFVLVNGMYFGIAIRTEAKAIDFVQVLGCATLPGYRPAPKDSTMRVFEHDEIQRLENVPDVLVSPIHTFLLGAALQAKLAK